MPPKKKANGYKFPEKLPKGETLVDVAKKSWTLGDSIGKGGFGEIYCAAQGAVKNPSSWPFVIKIEPHENGPLFMEKNFYLKFAKPDEVESWKKKEGLKSLGMPVYLGGGSHDYDNNKYRFLVIDRFGQDLQSLLVKHKEFPPHTVYKCALQILDTLKYIHSQGYMHGDIKGANLLLGWKSGLENNIFLVDFGLASKYSQKPFQADPKQAHNGTIEYLSCDMHCGVPTRRADLENLGYILLHWLEGSLPWQKDISKKEIVHKKKQELMKDVEGYISKNFSNIPRVIVVYMAYVSKLKHDEEPNYKYCKELFIKELKEIGSSPDGPLEFTPSKSSALTPNKRVASKKKGAKAVNDGAKDDDEVPVSSPKMSRRPRKVQAKPPGRKAARKNEAISGSDEEEEFVPVPKKRGAPKPRGNAKPVDVFDVDTDDPEMDSAPEKAQSKPRGRKAAPQMGVIPDTDEDEELVPVPKKRGSPKSRGNAKAVPPPAASDDHALDDPELVSLPKKMVSRKPRGKAAPQKKITPAESDDDEPIPSPSPTKRKNMDDPVVNGDQPGASEAGTSKRSKVPPKSPKNPSKTGAKLNWRDAPKCLIDKKM